MARDPRDVLSYDPASGLFTWKTSVNKRIKAGSVAGSLNTYGYVQIRLDGRSFYGHRLAFRFMTGEWPNGQVDHRDLVRSNNRWTNLRPATPALNSENRRTARRDNKSGLLGVQCASHSPNFHARIRVDGRRINLGTYADKHEAHAAYVAAKRLLHEGCTL